MSRTELLGLPVDVLTLKETVDCVEEMVRGGGTHQHVVLNAAKVVKAADDPALAAIIRSCDLVNADGMSIVWASRLLGRPLPERVTGIDLMDALLARAAELGWPVYFLGAQPDVVQRVVEVEVARHQGLIVAGFRDGYWNADEEDEVVGKVAAACPEVLFLAIPSPAKEEFLARHRDQLSIPFVMGVGGSFDVVAGVTSRAPLWMQRFGLEWVHRLILEPRRMFKRYLVGNSKFILLVARHWRTHR